VKPSGITGFVHQTWKTILIGGICVLLFWWWREPFVEFIGWFGNREAVAGLIEEYGNWGVAVYSALLVLQLIVAFVPGQALVFAGGYVFGFWKSLFITIPVAVIGSQVAFSLARRYGRPLAYRLATQRAIDRWESISKNQGIFFYFLAFNLPIFPSDAMCYVAGLASISARRFFIANLFGRTVSTVFTVMVGAYGLTLPPAFWVVVLLTVIGLYAAWVIYARKHKLKMK